MNNFICKYSFFQSFEDEFPYLCVSLTDFVSRTGVYPLCKYSVYIYLLLVDALLFLFCVKKEYIRDLQSYSRLSKQKLCRGANEQCPEAIRSIQLVENCPRSEEEWEDAASIKNCSKMAWRQNCTSAKEFVYHCVINAYINETLEVCAPKRIILGKTFLMNKIITLFLTESYVKNLIYLIICAF